MSNCRLILNSQISWTRSDTLVHEMILLIIFCTSKATNTISCVRLIRKIIFKEVTHATMIYLAGKLKRAGKTARQLALEVGVSEQVAGAWVHGTKQPKAHRLPLIAAALGCTVDDLYREEATE